MQLLFGPCSVVGSCSFVVAVVVGIVGFAGTVGSFELVAMADYILVVGSGTSDIFADNLFDCNSGS